MKLPTLVLILVLAVVAPFEMGAQQGRGAAQTPKAAAPIDLSGYWVALITEDWRYRMMVPAKGDFPNVPLNPEGRKIANDWDPAKDETSGNQCAAYGAGGVTRMTGRYHFTWADDNMLKAEADTGTQTRLFVFGGGANNTGENTWQGVSRATWEFSGEGGRGSAAGGRSGSLKVVTTRMKPGYIQRNGVPYSANAVITEYFDVVKEDDGTQYMVVTTLIEDPTYLARRFQRSTHFRKEADGSKWDPTACIVR